MDIKEVWSEFKDRINSPLFGSFIISWTAVNWRIPIVLLFYKSVELANSKTSYIDVIERYSNWWDSLAFPLLLAASYILIYPHIKRLISRYITKEALKTDKILLEINDKANIPVSLFIATKNALKESEKELANLISEEGTINEKNKILVSQIATLELSARSFKISHQNDINKLKDEQTKQMSDFVEGYDNEVKAIREELDDTRLLYDGSLIKMSDLKSSHLMDIQHIKALSKQEATEISLEISSLKSLLYMRDQELSNTTTRLDNLSEAYNKAFVENETQQKKLNDIIEKQIIQLQESNERGFLLNERFLQLKEKEAVSKNEEMRKTYDRKMGGDFTKQKDS